MRKLVLGAAATIAGGLSVLFVVIWFWPPDPILDCLDDGGRWVYEIDECECTYSDIGGVNRQMTEADYELCRKSSAN